MQSRASRNQARKYRRFFFSRARQDLNETVEGRMEVETPLNMKSFVLKNFKGGFFLFLLFAVFFFFHL